MTQSLPAHASPNHRSLSFMMSTIVSGLLIVAPVYLAALVLLKAANALAGLVAPIVRLLPEWLPAETLLSILVLLLVCFLVGIAEKTTVGRDLRQQLEKSLFQRIPGYTLLTGLTQRLAGETDGKVWQPVLIEIEEALVPAFVIEELEDGRLTVFAPSAPTPFAGTIYVIDRKRVHFVDVPFARATWVVSQWGFGAKDLVAAIRPEIPSR